MKRLAIIDGKSVFYRGYYAMSHLSTSEGVPTGGVFGFVSLSIELIKQLNPDYVAVAWDKRGTNIQKRLDIYPEYKAGRKPAPPDFYEQIPILHDLLEAFGWPLYEIDGYEADDIMATFSREATEKGIETILISSDLDTLQALSPTVEVYAMKNGLSNLEKFDVKSFETKYGIRVDQFLDYKALVGDSSDNIPGVPGVGGKTATKLLEEYDTLDNIYTNLDNIKSAVAKKLTAGRDSAFMSKKVAQLYFDVPLKLDWDIADVDDTDLVKVATILRKLEFTSLIRRLPEFMDINDVSNQASLFEEVRSSTQHEGTIVFLNKNGDLVVSKKPDDVKITTGKNDIKTTLNETKAEKIVGYDLKSFYHSVAGEVPHFENVFDIKQAEFLINPLKRDLSIEALFGGDIPEDDKGYANKIRHIYNRQMDIFAKDKDLKYIAEELDFKLIYLLYKMEKVGIKIDIEKLKTMSEKMDQQYKELEQQIYDLVGHKFNIASPKQLSEVLFDTLGLPTTGIKKGKTGHSTSQKELDKLRGQSPIVELVEKTRELAKLKNTYVDTLPQLADENSRVHTTFNQDVTSTGRLSSTNPNLQNIPIRTSEGRKIRGAFIPKEGNVFINADYSQFELRLAAILAGDNELIEDFNNDIDIHTKTASDVYGVPLEEVAADQRRNAKVINFGVLYGMSPHGLAMATGMTQHEARDFIDQYFKLRHKIRDYIEVILEKARKEGYVKTFYGRKRPTPDVKSSNYMVRSAAERAAANMPIQGTEADLMKRAMLKVEDMLNRTGSSAQQILQIHDSILIEAPKEEAQTIAEELKQVMENIAPELKIKLQADVTIGENWEAV